MVGCSLGPDAGERLFKFLHGDGAKRGLSLARAKIFFITFEEREAVAFDQRAVKATEQVDKALEKLPCGCHGTQSKTMLANLHNVISSEVP